jgi:hypothetical protein
MVLAKHYTKRIEKRGRSNNRRASTVVRFQINIWKYCSVNKLEILLACLSDLLKYFFNRAILQPKLIREQAGSEVIHG